MARYLRFLDLGEIVFEDDGEAFAQIEDEHHEIAEAMVEAYNTALWTAEKAKEQK